MLIVIEQLPKWDMWTVSTPGYTAYFDTCESACALGEDTLRRQIKHVAATETTESE